MVESEPQKARTLVESFGFAFKGVFTAWKKERNFRVQCLYGFTASLLLACFQPGMLASSLVLFSVFILLAAELANSSLERVVDLASPKHHTLAGQAKDMSAAAVMLISFASAGVLFTALWPEISAEAVASLVALIVLIFHQRFGIGGLS